MPNVKLAIRVRPFTEREIKSDKDRVPVVNVIDQNTITITNIKVCVSGAGDSRKRVRRYIADYTFDSACSETNPAYASQEKVFESIGREVLASVTRGASACVLAYGQSATGKTHTMMGTEAEPGLVPRLCRALAEELPMEVTVSFLEIYNERVHDLLVGEAPVTCHSLPRRRGNSRKDLRVREHPSRGPYVQNLRRVAVYDVETLLSLVEEGTRRRRTAATRRNSASSRSHALLELATPRATLHLADLAGSEKASWEGCGGGRQKEGANINKSLVALSNVISALVSGGSRGKFVPYRDSALTWLLKDCFTGGASTFIIATVSPSVACYGESASTLRWAARARHLPTPSLTSSNPSVASKAALQTQLNSLLAELARHHIRYIPETGKISFDDSNWTLLVEHRNIQLCDEPNIETKIGNIMNVFNPKAEAQTSESTASSAASGSSEVININTMDKSINIKDEISKEVDKLFGPTLERTNLERTKSGSDLEVTAPLRHRRRQYKSQEVLPIDKTLQIHNPNMKKSSLGQSQEQINETEEADKVKHIPILYDNQRAEIVASVTERLYSKLKKKEEAAVSKMESMMDKKIMEPLSELKICTNARQRLMELSQKAMRNKRRIGIPAHTQTRKMVTRVRDQGIDAQTDLEMYVIRAANFYTVRCDVATETIPMTPRCKEIAIGPICGSLDFRDSSTITDNKQVVRKNSFMMTDIIAKCDRCTQTPIVPPPRRRKRAFNFSKYLKSENRNCSQDYASAPVISINISQQYPVDSESHSSDDNLVTEAINKNKPSNVTMTPDLLTNHNTIDLVSKDNDVEHNETKSTSETEKIAYETVEDNIVRNNNVPDASELQRKESEEFPDTEDLSLPRVTVDSCRPVNEEEMKDMILGRNENVYPYNIVLSPPKERENIKRVVKFKDDICAQSVASQTSWEWQHGENSKLNLSSDITNSEKDDEDDCKNLHGSNCSDSTDSNRLETGSFIWKKGGTINQHSSTIGNLGRGYTPVYKCNNSRYKTARSKLYKEFLGLDKGENEPFNTESRQRCSSLLNFKDVSSSESTENELAQYKFRQRRQFFEDKFKRDYNDCRRERFSSLERNLLDSCNSLDTSVNHYESYLVKFHDNHRKNFEAPGRTPTEYLQHLVQLRREAVKADCDTDSSVALSYKIK